MSRSSYNLFLTMMMVILLLGAGGCSSYRQSVKRNRAQTEHEKAEKDIIKKAEKGLKGDEKKILQEAMTWIGTPYQYGAHEKGTATDCSGFVMEVFLSAIDCKLPRNSAKQADFCDHVSHRHIKPGDLVFFATGKDDKISHVGIMIDEIEFIHASSSKGVVISSMESSYYKKHFKKYGRVPCLKH